MIWAHPKTHRKNDAKMEPAPAPPVPPGLPLMDSVQEDTIQENNKTTKNNKRGCKTEGAVQKVKCKVRQHASDEGQHASGASGPVRISVAYGNVPAPGL